MCCFSQAVELVADTSIFVRAVNGRQYLVYSMRYVAATDLAMVLPLPVPPRPPEDAVHFINLKGYPEFFEDMASGFPEQTDLSISLEGVLSLDEDAGMLQIHDVGDFEA